MLSTRPVSPFLLFLASFSHDDGQMHTVLSAIVKVNVIC